LPIELNYNLIPVNSNPIVAPVSGLVPGRFSVLRDLGFAVRFQASVNVLQRAFYIWESGHSTTFVRQYSLSSARFAVSFAVKIGCQFVSAP